MTGGEVLGAGLDDVIDMAAMSPRALCRQNSFLNNDSTIEIKQVRVCVGGALR